LTKPKANQAIQRRAQGIKPYEFVPAFQNPLYDALLAARGSVTVVQQVGYVTT
jgi:hypothetical protein